MDAIVDTASPAEMFARGVSARPEGTAGMDGQSDGAASNPRIATGGGRRERNKAEKLGRIVAAAKHLFAERGFEQTTTQAIAEAADIGAGTLFLYARTKEDLLIMVFRDEMIATSREAFSHLPRTASLVAQLMHVFKTMIAYHERDTELTKILLREIMIPRSAERLHDVTTLMRVVYGGIGDIVAAGQAAGRVRPDINTRLAAESLFAIYFLCLIDWLGGTGSQRKMIQRLRRKLEIAIGGFAQATPENDGRKPRARQGNP